MNHFHMHQCLPHQKTTRTTFKREIYQVDASRLCRLIKENEKKTFSQLLSQASIDRLGTKLTNHSDLISIGLHWNASECRTSHIEDLILSIDPFICLRELFYDVPINDYPIKQLNLIGLICFYGSTIEVFFSYESRQSQWYFCLDGNLTIMKDWNDVRRKCLDFHLQPFLLIYANSKENYIDVTQLLKRTVVQAKTLPSSTKSVSKQSLMLTAHDLSKISSFATLNSSMLFLPQTTLSSSTSTTTNSYINQETVAKVMQQQLLKKELLTDTSSNSSSSSSSSSWSHFQGKSDENLSSGDSGLGSAINDESNETSPRDSLVETEDDQHFDLSLTSIEYYLAESLKYESASNYSLALESCQRALTRVDQILELNHKFNTSLLNYARTRKNSLLLRIRSLKKRQIQHEESTNLTYQYIENTPKKRDNPLTSILSSTTRLSRPKKNVKFSDNVALVVPTCDDQSDEPSEHLIHSFLRNIHQQQSTSDSDSDTPSTSSNDLPIGLIECSLCHKRFSKTNQIGTYCSNCHFYMQRFQPISPS